MSDDRSDARREFLETCGRFAACMPPSIVLLLAADRSYAAAASRFVSPFEANVRQGNNTAPGPAGNSR